MAGGGILNENRWQSAKVSLLPPLIFGQASVTCDLVDAAGELDDTGLRGFGARWRYRRRRLPSSQDYRSRSKVCPSHRQGDVAEFGRVAIGETVI
jgi:hypothetical protein